MRNNSRPIPHYLLAAISGAVMCYAAIALTTDNSLQSEKIIALENKILDLELVLAQKDLEISRKDDALKNARWLALDSLVNKNDGAHSVAQSQQAQSAALGDDPSGTVNALVVNAEKLNALDQKLRALSASSEQDPRSFAEKIDVLLQGDASAENIAVATKGLLELAGNPEILPDQALDMLYSNQANPDIKRVAAQVLSMRGDNRLIEKQVNEAQASLHSDNVTERQQALIALGKTRHASAANVIAPLLQDSDTAVKLEALLALRATGNQQHVYMVEALVNHPDTSVSWLARDVVTNLQNLSDKARTQLSSADINAELPVLQMP
ncbi:HEAT repeat domain-containing protein [Cellvibrio sp. pealriver]|uniref:HEAT repeat domain-containing protein n=1 Tax=Cellvibrio sp. pealriver TaxID=1622269 RepID=UPI0009E5FD7F|nr:HEAT repeat domain-containing protein [Cellvibrio sp. pealriver]